MKKLILLVTFILLIFPVKVNAVDVTIKDISISGSNNITIGDSRWIDFNITFNNLPRGYNNSIGIGAVMFELEFDTSVLAVTNIRSDSFESSVVQDTSNKKYYVISEVIGGSANTCAHGLLYCGDYNVRVEFYAKNTSVSSTTIRMKEVHVGVLDAPDPNHEYTDDDVVVVSMNMSKSLNLTINPAFGIIEPPKSIIESGNANSSLNSSSASNNTSSSNSNKKSDNNNLKSLTIDDYEIEFAKNKKVYFINIDEKVNQLFVNAETEHEKATLKIAGADNLKENNYIVKITVTAESGKTTTYTISAKAPNQTVEEKPSKNTSIFGSLFENINISKKTLTIGAYVGGGILFLIILGIVISKISDYKLNKQLKEFDKE